MICLFLLLSELYNIHIIMTLNRKKMLYFYCVRNLQLFTEHEIKKMHVFVCSKNVNNVFF